MSDAQEPPPPSEGESPRDEQSETVSAPHSDPDPPVRDKRAPASMALLVGFCVILGVALVVLAVMVLV